MVPVLPAAGLRYLGTTVFAALAPLLLTVKRTVNCWPVTTTAGMEAAVTSRSAGLWMLTDGPGRSRRLAIPGAGTVTAPHRAET